MEFKAPVPALRRILTPFKVENNAFPMYSLVIIDASAETLVVQMATSAVFFQAWLKCPEVVCEVPGQIAVEYDTLLSLLRTYKKTDVLVCETSPSKRVHELTPTLKSIGYLDVRSEKVKKKNGTSIYAYDTDQLPDYYPVSDEVTIDSFPAWTLKRGLALVTHIGRGRGKRREYSDYGVFFQHRRDLLRLVTTDGHRLVLADYAVEQKEDYLQAEREIFAGKKVKWSLEDGLTLPVDQVDALVSVLGQVSDEATVKLNYCTGGRGDDRFSFVVYDGGPEAIEYRVSAMLEGRDFPSFRETMFMRSSHEVLVNREVLLSALQRVQTLTNACRLSVVGDEMIIEARNMTNDDFFSRETMDVLLRGGQVAVGEPMSEGLGEPQEDVTSLGLNVSYLGDMLNQLNSPCVRLGFRSKIEPMAIQPSGVERLPGGQVKDVESMDGAYTVVSVVMPMKL